MSYTDRHYDDSSGTQDSNTEWYGEYYYNSQQDSVQYQTSPQSDMQATINANDQALYSAGPQQSAEASLEDNPWPRCHGSFVENELESLDGLHRRHDRKFYCQDTRTGNPDCTESFDSRSLLNPKLPSSDALLHAHRKHLRSHVRPVVCPFRFCPITAMCYHQTAEQRDMKRHVRSNHREWAKMHGLAGPDFVCEHCAMHFTREDNLVRHVRSQHG
ncbi:hypothetical protein PpBr36_09075 [Pyricularia pennisetigena]|uniref:hypothetical protein n=1 Tax=Pyricularia pennisetigena TaxID=1578925 RepID=UPI00114F7C91|nr:hypothetical protein PpBr36_09075 [Pyricularia pennisetigena]TLS24885.1 hypothetical protein PpBr36_09075 [Pyricularia pennisetigena]